MKHWKLGQCYLGNLYYPDKQLTTGLILTSDLLFNFKSIHRMIGVRETLPKRLKVNSYIIFLYLQKQIQLVILYHLGQVLNILKQFRIDERIFFSKILSKEFMAKSILRKEKVWKKKKKKLTNSQAYFLYLIKGSK